MLVGFVGGLQAQSDEEIAKQFRSVNPPDCESAIHYLRDALDNDPLNEKLLLQMGQCLAQLGQCDQAIPYLNKARALDPANFEIYQTISNCQYAILQYDLAILTLDQVFRYLPNDPKVTSSLDEQIGRVAVLEDGIQWLDAALAKTPQYEYTYWRISRAYYNLEDYTRAIQTIKLAQKMYPQNRRLILSLGRYYRADGKIQDALNVFQNFLIADQEPDPEVYYQMGITYLAANNLIEADNYFRRLYSTTIDDVIWKEQVATAYIDHGKYLLINQKDYAQAKIFFDSALAASQDSIWQDEIAMAYVEGGQTFLKPEIPDLSAAKTCFDLALKMIDNDIFQLDLIPNSYYQAGLVFLDTTWTEIDLARLCFDEIIRLTSPNDQWLQKIGETYYLAGITYLTHHYFDIAMELFDDLNETMSSDSEWQYKINLAFFQAGREYLSQNKLATSKSLFDYVEKDALNTSHREEMAQEYLKLGNIYYEKTEEDSAVNCYISALDLDSTTVADIFPKFQKQPPYLEQITSHSERDMQSNWLPDDQGIVFTSLRQNRFGVWVKYFDDESPQPLVNLENGNEWDGTISTDGKQIALISDANQTYDLWITDIDGRNERSLTNHLSHVKHPAWSSSGMILAYTLSDANLPQVWIINQDGRENKRLTPTDSLEADPAWHPMDDNYLAVTSYHYHHQEKNEDITIIKLDDNTRTRIINHPANDYDPSWSPDGKRLVFVSDRGKTPSLWIVSTSHPKDGQMVIENGTQPAWSPNGDWIAFTSNRQGNDDIWRIRISTPSANELKMFLKNY